MAVKPRPPLAPLAVSPLIKRREYAAIENAIREKEEADRPAREAMLAREKLRRDTAELRELEKIFLGSSSTDENATLEDLE